MLTPEEAQKAIDRGVRDEEFFIVAEQALRAYAELDPLHCLISADDPPREPTYHPSREAALVEADRRYEESKEAWVAITLYHTRLTTLYHTRFEP